MRSPDTAMGGLQRDFPHTTGVLLSRLADPTGTNTRAALELIGRRYWKPVYGWVRAAWSKSSEDAKDLTQAFFLRLHEGDALRNYARERGSFRRYLKVLLRSFVRDQEKARAAGKRGGGVTILDLAALEDGVPEDRGLGPEEAFDAAWAAGLLERSVERVRERCAHDGRATWFRAFEIYDWTGEASTYSEAAQRLGVATSDVRNWLHAMREAVRAEARAELAETAPDEATLEEEWNALLGS